MPQRFNYTEDFKREVRELYGSEFDKFLDNGNPFLGRYLDDGSQGGISVEKILHSTSLDELQKEARILKRKKDIYSKYLNQPPNTGE